MSQPLHFFLGANTPQGFVSRFDQLADPADGWREFVIKGGPGTGKSTLMHKIADEFQPVTEHLELIHCSSDVDSLDGVIIHDRKVSIADGTPPHGWRTQTNKFIPIEKALPSRLSRLRSALLESVNPFSCAETRR